MAILVQALRGVPKAALRKVLGDELGAFVWAKARDGSPDAARTPEQVWPTSPELTDEEIVLSLLGHLSRQAVKSLIKEHRRALVLSLCLGLADGRVLSGRARLAKPASASKDILREVETIYRRLLAERLLRADEFAASIRRLGLDVTATVPEAIPGSASAWRWRPQTAAGLA